MNISVVLYALSTCGWCRRVKEFLEENDIPYQGIDVDLLDENAKKQAREALQRYNERRSYPTTVIDGKEVVRGYDEKRLQELLGPCLTTKQGSSC